MNKKYQVFVSSTYEDLKEERKKVQEVLLTAECIPIGMEAFVADNDDQFNIIKRKIDLCDYYILIIGKRYGSVNKETQISYTEMEYDYAVEKAIPVLVFAINETINAIDDNDAIKAKKLAAFREKALKNRMAYIWDDINDLAVNVVSSISNAKINIVRPGWVRGGKYNTDELLEQINSLRVDNANLNKQNQLMEKTIKELTFDDAEEKFWDKIITIPYIHKKEKLDKRGRFGESRGKSKTEIGYFCKPWYEVYQYIAPYFYKRNSPSKLNELLISLIGEADVTIDESEVLKLKHQMLALNYIETHDVIPYRGKPFEDMVITKKGMTALNKILLTK